MGKRILDKFKKILNRETNIKIIGPPIQFIF